MDQQTLARLSKRGCPGPVAERIAAAPDSPVRQQLLSIDWLQLLSVIGQAALPVLEAIIAALLGPHPAPTPAPLPQRESDPGT